MIGFMQGRMVAQVDGRIQAFPWSDWRKEFPLAEARGFSLMEWTLDQDRLSENPLMTADGQAEIRELARRHRVSINSMTGDCFMQAPFWKAADTKLQIALKDDFRAIGQACATIGVNMLIMPLVDGGKLSSRDEEDGLVEFMAAQKPFLDGIGVKVIFESDYTPRDLARFIARLDADTFGVNYDMGNSAALGFAVEEEIASYGERIMNVHVKDRVRGGTTVPLQTGAVDLEAVFAALAHAGYRGDYILQTARAADGTHVPTLCRYRDLTAAWIEKYRSHAA